MNMKNIRFIPSFFIFLMISIYFLPGCKDKVKETATFDNNVIDSTSIPDIGDLAETLIDTNQFVRVSPEPNKFKNIQRAQHMVTYIQILMKVLYILYTFQFQG